MTTIAVIGLGKVGNLVASLLAQQFNVTGFDLSEPSHHTSYEFTKIDITNTKDTSKKLSSFKNIVSCLPYNLNKQIAKIAHTHHANYFDLTEDIATTDLVKELSKTNQGVMVPQCGLAPGFIGIIGAYLIKKFTKLRDVELRVGALPRFPNGQLGYSFNWSPAGVINEYLNDAEVIHNGVRKFVPSLSQLEVINIEGQEYEAFSTSGGLGTLCKTLEGKLDTLNYKTIRYPGHAQLMRFLLSELLLKNEPELITKILTDAKPPVNEDLVHVYAVVEGWKNKVIAREEFFETFYPQTINDINYRAISWTTAASICSVIYLVAHKKLPQKGFVKQEDIVLEDFLNTPYGELYKNQIKTWKF
ncbi:saccharopine dehydrogenase NADP-binding domain-containing protein [Flavobacteriaceae bacterium]|nr:saccharopine dehydrogenase NADP-binding domain-containing protein [Flavobacteriaceae bacterium]